MCLIYCCSHAIIVEIWGGCLHQNTEEFILKFSYCTLLLEKKSLQFYCAEPKNQHIYLLSDIFSQDYNLRNILIVPF